MHTVNTISRHTWVGALGAAVMVAGSAHAADKVTTGPLFTQETVTLTRSNNSTVDFKLTIWNYNTDLNGLNATQGFRKGEALTMHNGALYVSGDKNADRFNNRLLTYPQAGSGDLSSATVLTQVDLSGVVPTETFGFEGLTVNTSNTGYGNQSDGFRLIGIEQGPQEFVQMNAAGEILVRTPSTYKISDIAYIPSRQRFATIVDGGLLDENSIPLDGQNFLQWHDVNNPNTILGRNGGTDVELPSGAKGMTVISAFAASILAGQTLSDPEYLLVSAEGTLTTNRLAIYALDDDFTLIDSIKIDGAIPAVAELEGVAFDSQTNRVWFIEDNNNAARLFTFTIPEPTTVLLLVAGLMATGLRRGRRV
jgi:hypothetical protein